MFQLSSFCQNPDNAQMIHDGFWVLMQPHFDDGGAQQSVHFWTWEETFNQLQILKNDPRVNVWQVTFALQDENYFTQTLNQNGTFCPDWV